MKFLNRIRRSAGLLASAFAAMLGMGAQYTPSPRGTARSSAAFVPVQGLGDYMLDILNSQKQAVVQLAAVDTAGGVLSWQNPEATNIIVTRIVLDITTAATGSCSISAGTTPTSATTSSANLIDTLDVNAAAGVFDNLGNAGTLGKTRQKVAAGKWLTISKASGATAGMAGYAYIWYTTLPY